MTTFATPESWPQWRGEPERLAVPGDVGAVPSALGWLEDLGQRWQLSPRTVFAVTLCADEILANIFRHGRGVDGTVAPIRLACGRVGEGIGLRIVSKGPGFDPATQPDEAPAASLESAEPGGHGLRLVRHYTRAMHYRYACGHDELFLIFA